jgi:hypothetical protein
LNSTVEARTPAAAAMKVAAEPAVTELVRKSLEPGAVTAMAEVSNL